jgi:hypothetical protein
MWITSQLAIPLQLACYMRGLRCHAAPSNEKEVSDKRGCSDATLVTVLIRLKWCLAAS